MDRIKLRAKILETKTNINRLKYELQNLQIEELKFSDDERQYFEVKSACNTTKIGKIKFTENFKDEDTGKLIPIERTPPVMYDGDWSKGLKFWAYNPKI